MKKKWLAVGLAAMIGCGCLFACEEGDENTQNVLKGEQVTQEQWNAAFTNIDLSNIVLDLKYNEWNTENVLTYGKTSKMIINGNNVYEYDESFTTNIHENNTQTEVREDYDKTETWMTEVNGFTYIYGKAQEYDEETSVWEDWKITPWALSTTKTVSEIKQELDDTFQLSFDILEQMGISGVRAYEAYKYDKNKKAYVMSVQIANMSLEFEVQFVNGEVYSFYNKMTIPGTKEEKFTFKTETIDLPDTAGLNALIEGTEE